jgi:hypothetical protein
MGIYADAFPLFLNWYPTSSSSVIPFDGPVSFTSREELGEGIAKLLSLSFSPSTAEEYKNQTLLLTSPHTSTLGEVAGVIGDVLGSPVEFRVVGKEEFEDGVVKAGKPKWVAEVLTETYQGIQKGEGAGTSNVLGKLLGREPEDGKEWVRRTLEREPGYVWHQQGKREEGK